MFAVIQPCGNAKNLRCIMNCNLTHFSTCQMKQNLQTRIIYIHILARWVLNIESQVQRIALRNTLFHTVHSVAHIFGKCARPCRYFGLKYAYCTQYTHCILQNWYVCYAVSNIHHVLSLTAAQRCRSMDRGMTDCRRGEGVECV